MKKTTAISTLVAAITTFMVSTASANLIVNGSFEDNNIKNESWKWFTSSDVNGWDGSNIEIWDSFRNVVSYEGKQHAELNAHANNGEQFSIYQTFATEVGTTYDVSFAYSARRNLSVQDEEFQFEIIGDSALIDENFTDHTRGEWSTYSGTFVADSTETSIRFTSIIPISDTTGNFIDAVSVTPTAVPELSAASAPISAALLLAMLGLGIERRRRISK